MPRDKEVLVKLKSGSHMTRGKEYIYNGTADYSRIGIVKGSKVIGSPSWKSKDALIHSPEVQREIRVNRSDLMELKLVKPTKFLVAKNSTTKEIFACGEDDAKEVARKVLGMKRLTGVTIVKEGQASPYSFFKVGDRAKVIGGTGYLHYMELGTIVNLVRCSSDVPKYWVCSQGGYNQTIREIDLELVQEV